MPWKEGLHQLVVFPSLGIKVTVQTWVIQKSQHFLVLFHTQVFFTCGKGNHRHVSYWPRPRFLNCNIRRARKQESPSLPGDFLPVGRCRCRWRSAADVMRRCSARQGRVSSHRPALVGRRKTECGELAGRGEEWAKGLRVM